LYKKRQVVEKKELEQRKKEEEANQAVEKVKRLFLEEERKKRELKKRIKALRKIEKERTELSASQSLTRAFVYSYFEMLDAMAVKIEEIEDTNSQKYIDKLLEYREPVRFVARPFTSYYKTE
jgi:hypothetical protein